jgi:non-lysosomal glucosylceramidase
MGIKIMLERRRIMPNKKDISKNLYQYGPQKVYNSTASEAAFLLGGIGTGNVSIGARGELRDWEMFNTPGKGNEFEYSFFSIYVKEQDKSSISRVLESRLNPPFSGSRGFKPGKLCGLPRLEKSSMTSEYPFVNIDFTDKKLPVKISLEAFTPFIPLNPDDSAIPCAILRYKVKNMSDLPVDASIACTLPNPVSYFDITDRADKSSLKENIINGSRYEFTKKDDISYLYMDNSFIEKDSLKYGNICISVLGENVSAKTWLNQAWAYGVTDFWNNFKSDGMLDEVSKCNSQEARTAFKKNIHNGSICFMQKLEPDKEKEYTFILSWYFPNRIKDWGDVRIQALGSKSKEKSVCKTDTGIVKNRYAKLFRSALEAGTYTAKNINRLEDGSRKFSKAFYSSSIPSYVLEAAASNITVLRSPTCFWLEDGTFAGWEGCHDKAGSCMGSCTHVWNYAQTIAFLFPSLERSMRNVEFNQETDEKGKMAFRTNSIFGKPRWDYYPAADGQMGTIIRLYREWKLYGDYEFLASMWKGAKRALDFAFDHWDKDGDFVLDTEMHNTFDVEFHGPDPLVNSMFLGALKAGAEMADAMGDFESATRYSSAFEKGSENMDLLLWEGEYYIQRIENVDKYKYQYGKGCLSDQLLGQFMCHVTGLGYVLPKNHVKKALESIFRYNYRESLDEYETCQRTYSLNDEGGLVVCSWPKGGKPRFPFPYSEEVWTGTEYQVAAHLIYEGFIDEGLTIVKTVRERHDGYRRNPWNEAECGYHYARSMSSWAVFIALSGFRFDMTKGYISFDPHIRTDDFSTFWSTGKAWGTYRQKKDAQTGKTIFDIEVLYGNGDDIKLLLPE